MFIRFLILLNLMFFSLELSANTKYVHNNKLQTVLNIVEKAADNRNVLHYTTNLGAGYKKDSTFYHKYAKKKLYNTKSVLSSGTIFRFNVKSTKVYHILYSELTAMGFSSPKSVKLYGNSGKQLPFMNSQAAPTGLEPIPIKRLSDRIICYLEGHDVSYFDTKKGHLMVKKHDYANRASYFLIENQEPDVLVSETSQITEAADITISQYRAIYWFEKNELNLIQSGRRMFGGSFEITPSQTVNFSAGKVITGSNMLVIGAAAVRAPAPSNIIISSNGTNTATEFDGVNLSAHEGYHARYNQFSFTQNYTGVSSTEFTLRKSSTADGSNAWLDYLGIQVKKELNYQNQTLDTWFGFNKVPDSPILLKCANGSTNLNVWQVRNLNQISALATTASQNGILVKYKPSNVYDHVIIFADTDTENLKPEGSAVVNQDLHGQATPDMVIICYHEFIEQAERLASFRKENDGLDVLVLTPQMVYNEFSSGNRDITAFRNLMKMFYSRQDGKFKYLLFIGDGSYDNRPNVNLANNYIPTYQSLASESFTGSFVTDDYFGLLDDHEGESTGLLDIGIGRLPVASLNQAKIAVDKIIRYESGTENTNWSTSMCFIADDADDSVIHMQQADDLAKKVSLNYHYIRIKKLYSDAFTQVSSSTGERYPEVNKQLKEAIENGVIIVNYTGHGSERSLSEEKILTVADVKGWENPVKLPIFVTATCEFSRFDDHDQVSAGEEVFLHANGGAIALFTTTRLVYSAPNFTLNNYFYDYVFKLLPDGSQPRLGDVMRLTKSSMLYGTNKRNFTLLGDPSIKIKVPTHKVKVTQINGKIPANADVLSAMSFVTVAGELTNWLAQETANFNGSLMVRIFDKAYTAQTQANDNNGSISYTQQNKMLYSGRAQVVNGKFEFSFRVPKDINYAVGNGKMQFYAQTNDKTVTAAGGFTEFNIGGFDEDSEPDFIAPEAELFLNHRNFLPNDTATSEAMLIAHFFDESGINTSASIGHSITVSVNGGPEQSADEYYSAELNNFRKGTLLFPLKNLPKGENYATVKVWDVANNSTVAELPFFVSNQTSTEISNTLNRPNPFNEETSIYFEHNLEASLIDVYIHIYDLTGKLVDIIEVPEYYTEAGVAGPFKWNASSSGKSSTAAVYLYRVMVVSEQGTTSIGSGKMIVY